MPFKNLKTNTLENYKEQIKFLISDQYKKYRKIKAELGSYKQNYFI